jgi:uncharacterized membrane protein AbrB (regulator of aidB expression)
MKTKEFLKITFEVVLGLAIAIGLSYRVIHSLLVGNWNPISNIICVYVLIGSIHIFIWPRRSLDETLKGRFKWFREVKKEGDTKDDKNSINK